jgi:hypothetical protein
MWHFGGIFMWRKFRRVTLKHQRIYSVVMMLLGVIILISWMPIWIWFALIGIALIVTGIKVYSR